MKNNESGKNSKCRVAGWTLGRSWLCCLGPAAALGPWAALSKQLGDMGTAVGPGSAVGTKTPRGKPLHASRAGSSWVFFTQQGKSSSWGSSSPAFPFPSALMNECPGTSQVSPALPQPGQGFFPKSSPFAKGREALSELLLIFQAPAF